MKLIGRIVCWAKGHRRGVQVGAIGQESMGNRERLFACPRCGHKTRYKVKPKQLAQSSPTDGSTRFDAQEAT
jgi:DNA-directed RNA polymerase subunit RPC12/RpoP